MAKRLAAAVAGLGLVLGCMGLVAAPAQAYPATVCSISVRPNPVISDHDVTVTGKANKAVDWTVRFGPKGATHKAEVVRGHGKNFRHVFHAPRVHTKVQYSVNAQCTGGPPMMKDVTIVPKKDNPQNNNNDHNGDDNGLPNTGGPSLWIALLALLLIAEGTRRVRRSRKADGSA